LEQSLLVWRPFYHDLARPLCKLGSAEALTCSASTASSGTIVTAVAPLPITTIFFIGYSQILASVEGELLIH
jgi:hypothetical protein